MSHLVSLAAPITGAHTVKQYAGFGILGADIPTTGSDGGSVVLNDSIDPTKEYHWRVTSSPSAGTLTIYPDMSSVFTSAPDGTYTWTYRLFENGVDQGTATVSLLVGVSTQQANPTSTATTGTWTANAGGSLHAALDETVADDSDYITTNVSGICEVAFAPLIDPAVSTGHTVRYRLSTDAGSITVRLRQGSTTIATWSHATPPTTATLFAQTLSAGEADSITNYAALSLQFEAI